MLNNDSRPQLIATTNIASGLLESLKLTKSNDETNEDLPFSREERDSRHITRTFIGGRIHITTAIGIRIGARGRNG